MSSTEFDTIFFKDAEIAKKDVVGIPGLRLNRPLNSGLVLGDVGLELEIEGVGLPRDNDVTLFASKSGIRWQPTTDGSLRGESREYIFSGPAKIDEAPELVYSLFDNFKKAKTELTNSNRCSTHVHLNMRGRKINELTSFYALYTLFEPALIKWCGEEREKNHFCLSVEDSTSTLDAWIDFLRNGTRPTRRGNIKYSAFNILPLWDKGSFEVRCGGPSDTPEMPIKWATFLHYLAQYSFENFKNPLDLGIAMSERGGFDLFKAICSYSKLGEEFSTEVLEPFSKDSFEDLTFKSFRRSQCLTMGFPWERWMTEINKEYVPDPFDNGAGSDRETAPALRLGELFHPRIGDNALEQLRDISTWRVRPRNQPHAPIQEPDNARRRATFDRTPVRLDLTRTLGNMRNHQMETLRTLPVRISILDVRVTLRTPVGRSFVATLDNPSFIHECLSFIEDRYNQGDFD